MLQMSKEQCKLYFSIKRFNYEDKDAVIKVFYQELKYSLNLIVGFKDIMDFIYDLLKLRSITDIDKNIRLRLHHYFSCEMTMVLHVLNPYNLESHSRIEG